MRIGIDGRLWYESGVGRYIRNLVLGLDEKNASNHTFTVFLNSKAYDEVEFKSSSFKKIVADVPWHTISEQWKFKTIIERQDLDLMHFPYFSYPVFYKKPFVITIHDLIIDHFPTGMASSLPTPVYYLKRFAYKNIIKSAVKNSVKVIVPSIATKVELEKHYNISPTKVNVIYEGFDSLIKGKTNKTELVAKNYILYVGNAYPHKNLEMLLEVFENVRKQKGVDLICIGRDDFFYKRFEKKRRLGVHFLHNVDDATLFDYYTNARLFVMPSLMEGFGLPILEAMSLSCPIVSSNAPSLKEIGEDGCYYFDPKNVDSMNNAILMVLKDAKFREELGKKGHEISKKYSWEKCINETLKVYESSNSL